MDQFEIKGKRVVAYTIRKGDVEVELNLDAIGALIQRLSDDNDLLVCAGVEDGKHPIRTVSYSECIVLYI